MIRSVVSALRYSVVNAGAMLAGYAAGIALVQHRVAAAEGLSAAIYQGQPGVEQLDPLHTHFGDCASAFSVYRLPDWILHDPGAWIKSGLAVIISAILGVAVAQWAPLWFLSVKLRNAPRSAFPQLRAYWRAALVRGMVELTSMGFLLVVAVAGAAGALLTEVATLLACVRGNAAGASMPHRPVLGILAVEDATWLLLWSMLGAAVAVVSGARRRLRGDAAFLARWCLHCGYPRPASPGAKATALVACPECGSTSAPSPTADRPCPWPGIVVLLGILVCLMLLAHHRMPQTAAVFRRWSGAAVGPCDLAIVALGSEVVVRHGTNRFWIGWETLPGEAHQGPSTGLRVMVEVPTEGATNAAPTRVVSAKLDPTKKGGDSAAIVLDEVIQLRLSAYLHGDGGPAYVSIVPGGATSIQAVPPGKD